MSGARRRSKSLWDNKEEAIPQSGKILDSSFHGDISPKRSNSEANDVFMSDDFSHDPMQQQPNENIPYRGGNRDRSRSPPRSRVRDRDRNRDERQESYDSGDIRNDSISRASSHRSSKEFASGNSRRGSQGRFVHPESGFRDDRNKDSDGHGHRKDADYHRDGEGYVERSHDENNKSWNDPSWNQESQSQYEQDFTQNPITLNEAEKSHDMNGGPKLEEGKPLEASRNGIPTENKEQEQFSQANEKQILASALELLYSLPNSGSSGAPVSDPIKAGIVADSVEQGNQIPVESDVKEEETEKKKKDENLKNTNNSGKNEVQGKVEEGDEKAMRQFKIVLVEFVKEILKPTWKEGKMSREVYKTIVKKVVEKVSSSIQGVQIPRTQEKIDQYLAFSKSKITKLVEAYVGRHLKA
ncbi:unnamed protein product [Lactuca virosa]|uniref:SFR19-like C-terminal domain-containing protein n=1 Tax=Lactuca virosa TaxID=75947 RepID=A0AAU9PWX7_9ASTR|nr:unnamed protein product [Lactuca virosa]